MASASKWRPPVSTGPVTTGHEKRLDDLVVAGYVVGVAMCREQVRDGQPVLVDGREQGLKRGARVDEDRRPARLVEGEVRLREPARMHAADDVHTDTLAT